jgi:hypothetical protein
MAAKAKSNKHLKNYFQTKATSLTASSKATFTTYY